MRVAFYAPMKSPYAATPSGDREIARRLIAAIERAGHGVEVASELRSFERTGDAARQEEIAAEAVEAAEVYVAAVTDERRPRPSVWFTYHCYHKAPDHIGPRVCDALGIPYVIAEASVAPRQAFGPWAPGFAAAHAAVAAADLVIGLNPRDEAGVRDVMKPGAVYAHLPAFLDASVFGISAERRCALRRRISSETGLFMHHDAGDTIRITGNNRQTARTCFKKHHADRLVDRWPDKHVRSSINLRKC